jgi:hypothetical protein
MRTRPYMSPTRPRLTTSTLVTSRKPIRIHRKYDVLPGASGFILMPRKMSGSAIIRIELLIVAISTPIVVLDSAIHLYDVRVGPEDFPEEGCIAKLILPQPHPKGQSIF